MIAETCTKLVELNLGRTWVTNHGLEKLSISPDWSVVRYAFQFPFVTKEAFLNLAFRWEMQQVTA